MASLPRECPVRSHFRPHQYLVRENDKPANIYRIEEGWACRFQMLPDGRRQITALFLPGDYCEPQWMFEQRACQPVKTITSVRVSRLPLEPDAKPASGSPSSLWTSMTAALERQASWLVTLGRKTAKERVAHLLCEIHERMSGRGLTFGCQCALPLTQVDIADITGLTAIHVNRTLQGLRSQGLIDLRSKWLHIHDLPALRDLSRSGAGAVYRGRCSG